MKYESHRWVSCLFYVCKTKESELSAWNFNLRGHDRLPSHLAYVEIALWHAEIESTQMQSICAHNPPPLGKLVAVFSWSEDGAVTDLLVSLVWAIRKGRRRRRRRRRRRAFLISSQADRRKPAPHLSHRGNALCSQQGVLWLAHLVSAGRRGWARVKLRKWDWESRVSLFSGLQPICFGLNQGDKLHHFNTQQNN